jgi:hypothetical protein
MLCARQRPSRRLIAAAFLLLAMGVGVASPADGRAQQLPEQLDTRLLAIVDAYDAGGEAAAAAAAQRFAISMTQDRVRVIIELEAGAPAANIVHAAGGGFERQHGDLIQVSLPIPALRHFSAISGVRLVRPPLRLEPLVVGQGVSLIEADGWHTEGVTGAGVKVAVLDAGFAGYTSLLGTELPASVTTRSFRMDEDITGGGINHGTGVARSCTR